MNENSPICASATATVRLALNGWRTTHMNSERRQRTDDQDDRQRAGEQPRRIQQRRRVEQHADRDEEQHRERIAHRQRVRRGAQAVVGAADDHAGEERAERHRHAEQPRRPDRDAERDHQHRQREQLARLAWRRRDRAASGITRAPTIAVKSDQRRHLQRGQRDRHPDRLTGFAAAERAPAAARSRAP